ncbi:MAG: hypothetical protein K2N53_07115, partial [Clostridia bacterium]|nr:hypothetical protein [Clostridia bacterium]
MLKSNEIKKFALLTLLICMIATIFSCVGIYLGAYQNAGATSTENLDTQSIELGNLLLNNYKNLEDGKIFDKQVFWNLISQISGVENPNMKTLNTLGAESITSKDIRGFNGEDVIITIDGKKWVASYVSRNTKDEPILTLWLAGSPYNVINMAAWNSQSSDSIGKYPNNLYGTSEVRARTLNNGGGYARRYNDSTLTPVAQNSSSEWAIYTMDKSEVSGSIKEYIEVPNNMQWQLEQKAKDHITSSNYVSNYYYNNNNDALNFGGDGNNGDFSNDSIIDSEGYRGWANDTLWLPSVTETGVSGEEGVWDLTDDIRMSDSSTWLRSTYYYSYYYIQMLYPSGNQSDAIYVNLSQGIRPAFHLNLKLVAENVGQLGMPNPTDVTSEYTGQTQTLANITDESKISWYNSAKMTLEYPSGMTDAGTYQVKVRLISDDEDEVFTGEPDTSKGESADNKDRIFNFTINKKKIGVSV